MPTNAQVRIDLRNKKIIASTEIDIIGITLFDFKILSSVKCQGILYHIFFTL